jgi:hypothetical protein
LEGRRNKTKVLAYGEGRRRRKRKRGRRRGRRRAAEQKIGASGKNERWKGQRRRGPDDDSGVGRVVERQRGSSQRCQLHRRGNFLRGCAWRGEAEERTKVTPEKIEN